jgi:hypothetical protein
MSRYCIVLLEEVQKARWWIWLCINTAVHRLKVSTVTLMWKFLKCVIRVTLLVLRPLSASHRKSLWFDQNIQWCFWELCFNKWIPTFGLLFPFYMLPSQIMGIVIRCTLQELCFSLCNYTRLYWLVFAYRWKESTTNYQHVVVLYKSVGWWTKAKYSRTRIRSPRRRSIPL